MSIRSVHSARTVFTQRSANAFIFGACGAVSRYLDADGSEYRVERGGEPGVAVADQVGEPTAGLGKFDGEVAGQLDRPRAGRVRR